MSIFSFKAVGPDGSVQEGRKEAANETALINQLQSDGMIPIKVTEEGLKSSFLSLKRDDNKVNHKEILLFTKELATLLQAGLPLDKSLSILDDLLDKKLAIHPVINQVLQRVKGGENLSDALSAESTAFSKFYINMLRAGEAGGNIETVLLQLAEYLEKSKELKDTITTALIYPAILVVMAVGSVLVLLTFVVPQFIEMFDSAGKELPLSTQVVVAIANWLQNWWWLMGIAMVTTYLVMKFEITVGPRKAKWDRWILNIPVLGEIIRNMNTANFSRTLGTLLTNGVPILTALGIVKETINNLVLVNSINMAEDNLKQGKDISSALIESEQFPKMAMQMIKMGEETGKLEEMLQRTAFTYDKQLKITIERMLALLEPTLIVSMGLIISGIIISILSAILSVNDLAF